MDDIQRRAEEYAGRYNLRLDGRLDRFPGKDGNVYRTADPVMALKVFARQETFRREAAAYARLASHGVVEVCGHHVPQVERMDNELLAIEMTIVTRPYILDFASACLDDDAPEFPDDVIAEWEERGQEEFGANWPKVCAILAALSRMGVHMTDVHPGNIAFADRE